MDLTTTTDWLKNTIPGIILLGVIESISAAIIITAFNRLILPALKQSLAAAFNNLLMHFFLPASKQLVRLHFVNRAKTKSRYFTRFKS